MIEWQTALDDGRILGGAEYGDPNGKVMFLFHGQPGNRLFHPNEELTRQRGIRLVVPDRPGYGLSGFQERRKLLDWPSDVVAIADYFGLKTVDVVGFSGGGPYALACAYALPDRIRRVCLVSGAPPMAVARLRNQMMPLARINYALARYAYFVLAFGFKLFWLQNRKDPPGSIAMMQKQMPAADQKILADPEFGSMLMSVWEENLRVDSRGYAVDAKVLMQPWGFNLSEIKLPVELWWGELDANVPPSVLEFFVSTLPNTMVRRLSNTGHFGILSCWDMILDEKAFEPGGKAFSS